MKPRPRLRVTVMFHCSECESTIGVDGANLAALARFKAIQTLLAGQGWHNSSSRGWLCPVCWGIPR